MLTAERRAPQKVYCGPAARDLIAEPTCLFVPAAPARLRGLAERAGAGI
jgi:hypothetical protein